MKPGTKYPLAVVIGYGPDHKTVTKLVASIFTKPGQPEPRAIEKWIGHEGDIRKDPVIMAALVDFIKRHHAADNVSYNWVHGCPHEEGIDYPEGEACPQCPFWANLDRFTLEPKSLELPLTPKQILAGLACERDTQPLLGFAAADRHREQMIEPFLQTVERALNDPEGISRDDKSLFSYALAFLVKWREPRVYPLVVRWLSLPGEIADKLGGDTVTEWGSRMLATVCGGDLAPIKQLILNREADEYCRGQAIIALAVLAAWNEVPRAEVADYFGWLAREGLEREPGAFWDNFAWACLGLELVAVFDHLRQAQEEGLIYPEFPEKKLAEVEAGPPGEQFKLFLKDCSRFEDVAKETSAWACFSPFRRDDSVTGSALRTAFNEQGKPRAYVEPEPYVPPKPYIAPPKIGRNEPCPCGSGKKYKKCCGG